MLRLSGFTLHEPILCRDLEEPSPGPCHRFRRQMPVRESLKQALLPLQCGILISNRATDDELLEALS